MTESYTDIILLACLPAVLYAFVWAWAKEKRISELEKENYELIHKLWNDKLEIKQ